MKAKKRYVLGKKAQIEGGASTPQWLIKLILAIVLTAALVALVWRLRQYAATP